MSGLVSFVGAGPGAADLITVRGARRIGSADIVLWAANVVPPECVREHARQDAELIDSSRLVHEDAVETYRRAARDNLSVARVYSGDPALQGAVREQYEACVRLGVEVDVVAGVLPFSAAAASAGRDLTRPEVTQSVLVSRLDGVGVTEESAPERIRELAADGATLVLSASAARVGRLVRELRDGGYADDTPVLVAYKASCPDELLVHTTLGELVATLKQHRLWRNTLFLVGAALAGGGRVRGGAASNRGHRWGEAARSGRSGRSARSLSTSDTPNSGEETAETARPVPAGTPVRGPGRGSSVRDSAGHAAASPGSGGSPPPEELPQPRSERPAGQPDAHAAWWAVRSWQQTARTAAPRLGGARRSGSGSSDRSTVVFSEQAPGPACNDDGNEASANNGSAEPQVDSSNVIALNPDRTYDAPEQVEEPTASSEAATAEEQQGGTAARPAAKSSGTRTRTKTASGSSSRTSSSSKTKTSATGKSTGSQSTTSKTSTGSAGTGGKSKGKSGTNRKKKDDSAE